MRLKYKACKKKKKRVTSGELRVKDMHCYRVERITAGELREKEMHCYLVGIWEDLGYQ